MRHLLQALQALRALRALQAVAAGGAAFVFAQAAGADALSDSLHVVHLERGADLSVIASKQAGATPTVAVLLFAGYPGILNIRTENGALAYDLKGNFLIRARRHLADADIFTVMVDCPSDERGDCGDAYRASARHAADVAAVAALARREPGARQVYVAGTSYGTVSTAYLARSLKGVLDGAIHTATFTDPQTGRNAHGAALASFDWSRGQVPQLFVHHRDDPCALTRYASIVQRKGTIPLVTVTGSVNPHGDACQAYTEHGFVGREQAVMRAIAAWVMRREVSDVGGGQVSGGKASGAQAGDAAARDGQAIGD
ncbi:hypothetical protein IP92_04851 [Pseudoduganella flava]|uniref:Alpha/beta hydrolase n=1 Tax=Pseudoduganella flava TaxID=871742 RepID=A0A562PH82_9BURK|nr:alpha/beta hydrolase [Pseudoduganella flava]TWI43797.1 hypothetical protein IP92_04851 [Pseudoduganella flava]